MPMSKLTTVAVSREVYEALQKLGHTGESFDTVLRRLLKVPSR
jgi:predicted CopG family antitoxin